MAGIREGMSTAGEANKGGRPQGSHNRTTTQMRDMIIQIVNEQLDGVAEALEEIKQKDKAQYIKLTQKFVEMVLPKQQEISVTEAPKIDVEATISQMKEALSADA